MVVLSLIFSIIALVLSYLAYRKSGGSTDELKSKVEDLGITTENLRSKTADALNRLEKTLRGENKSCKTEECQEEETATAEVVTETREDREEPLI